MTSELQFVEVLFTVVDRPFRLIWDATEKIAPGWEDWLVRELRAHTYDVEFDGDLVRVLDDAQRMATLAFRSVAEMASKYGDEPWFQERSPCPWVGRVLGYVEYAAAPTRGDWESRHTRRAFAGWLGHLAIGPVIDLVYDGEVHQPLEESQFPLSHCLKATHGFHDGVISVEEAYMTMIETEINDRIRKIGIGSRVFAATGGELLDLDKHTAFAFNYAVHPEHDPIVDLQGKRIRRPEELLEKEFISLWTYDLDLKDKIQSIGIYSGPELP